MASEALATVSGEPAAAPVPVSAVASIDGGAGSTAGNATATNKRRDVVSVDGIGAALDRVDIAWERGVKFRPVPSLRKARLVGAVEITQVKDPAATTSYDDVAQQPVVTRWNAWLRPGSKGRRLTLWLRGPSTTITARIDATREPKLHIQALPERTIYVGFHTSGRLGVGLLAQAKRRTESAPVQTRISGTRGGADFDLLAEDESGG